MYRLLFFKSLKKLKYWLFLPDIYLLMINLALAFLFFKFTNVNSLLGNPDFIASGIEKKIPIITLFISQNFLSLLIYLIIFVFTSFILGSSLTSVRYGMLKSVVFKEQFSFKKALGYASRFWSVVLVRLVIYTVGLITLLFILGSFTILKSYYPLSFSLFVVALLGWFVVFFLKFLFLFVFASMFIDNKGAFASIKKAFYYSLRNKKHAFKVFFVVFAFSFILVPFEFLFNQSQSAYGLLNFYTVLFFVLRGLVSVLYTVWSELFIFYAYKPRSLVP